MENIPQTKEELLPWLICTIVGAIIRFFEKRKIKKSLEKKVDETVNASAVKDALIEKIKKI